MRRRLYPESHPPCSTMPGVDSGPAAGSDFEALTVVSEQGRNLVPDQSWVSSAEGLPDRSGRRMNAVSPGGMTCVNRAAASIS